ncbi:MAG: S1 RNA-binding domain-containing protein [Acidobacteriota bacterium]
MALKHRGGLGPGRSLPKGGGSSDEFEKLLAQQGDRTFDAVRAGERVEGTVVAISDSSILVDIGQRSEGVVSLDEVRQEDLGKLRVGDRGEFLVSRISGSGIELSWALSAHKLDLARIDEARHSGVPVEGKVSGENKGGFTVELGGVRGFVPFSQMELGQSKPLAEYVNHTFRFRVIEVRGRDVVLSRAALLRDEQERLRRERLATLHVGEELEAEVIKIERFGVFVDVGGGLHALIPTGELAWSAQDEVKAVLEPGVNVLVKLTEIQVDGPKPKIAASMRQVTQDPWLSASDRFAEGQVVKGRVTRMMPFGAFLEIAPGIEALLHISQMSDTKQVRAPQSMVRLGETLEVAITSIDSSARRIGLSLTATPDAQLDPETRAKYMQTDAPSSGGGNSAMADALRKALNKPRP